MGREGIEFEPVLDDERVEDLDDDEPVPPPTIDPDERIERTVIEEDEPIAFDDDRPVDL